MTNQNLDPENFGMIDGAERTLETSGSLPAWAKIREVWYVSAALVGVFMHWITIEGPGGSIGQFGFAFWQGIVALVLLIGTLIGVLIQRRVVRMPSTPLLGNPQMLLTGVIAVCIWKAFDFVRGGQLLVQLGDLTWSLGPGLIITGVASAVTIWELRRRRDSKLHERN